MLYTELKFASFYSSGDSLSDGILFFTEVKIVSFCPKTMDYNKAFWPKSSSFFVFFLLQSGRCYKAVICTILFPLRCAIAWYYILLKSKFSDSGQKP